MEVRWTRKACSDLARLHDFLARVDRRAAARVAQALARAPHVIRENPWIGESVPGFEPRDVRRLRVDTYEIRYELTERSIYILRLWRTREDR
jgi:plasmid stabilization system protein ParE